MGSKTRGKALKLKEKQTANSQLIKNSTLKPIKKN